MLTKNSTTHAWQESLRSCGFRLRTDGCFRRNGFTVRADQSWLTFEKQAKGETDAMMPETEHAGLWKCVADQTGTLRHEFHLPASIGGRDREEEESEESPLRAVVAWVLATGAGRLPGGWEAPRAEVEALIPAGGLSVQSGPFAVQGSLICEPERLKLAFPLFGEASDRLSANRRAWLRCALLDAQNRWRMVRIVVREQQGRLSSTAEVDLSGAPPILLEELFPVSLDSLRWVVSWLIRPVRLLADPGVECDTWELPPEMSLNGGLSDE